MGIRIVTDSTCDLPKEILAQNNIAVIPLYINIGEREFRDTVDLSRHDFYQQLPNFRPSATTAAPGPNLFRQVYEELASDGATEILSIHISEKLSSVAQIAQRAAAETSAIPVTAFDSRQLSLGTGYLVLTAAQAAAQGKSMQEIIDLLEEQIPRIHVFAALDTLEFLHRGGRMNFVMSTLGSLLQIKPILKMFNGTPSTEKVRTRKGASNRLLELLTQYGPYEKVAILHSGIADQARSWLQELREMKDLLPDGEIWLEEINPVLGAHIGPGVLGFACLSKEPVGGK